MYEVLRCGREFRTQGELKAALNALREGPVGPLTGDDLEFLLEYYSWHTSPNHQRTPDGVSVIHLPGGAKGFAAMIAGEPPHPFGWKNPMAGRPHRTAPPRAGLTATERSAVYRQSVQDQVREFRESRRCVDSAGVEYWVSEVYSVPFLRLTFDEVHVDHDNRVATFAELIRRFEEEKGAPEMVSRGPSGLGHRFTHSDDEQRWQAFHREHARLRILSADQNQAPENK